MTPKDTFWVGLAILILITIVVLTFALTEKGAPGLSVGAM